MMVNGNNNFGIFLEPQDQHGVLRSTSSPSSLNLNTHLSHHYPLPSSNLEAKIYSVSSPLTQQLSLNISLKTSSNENKLNVSQVLYKLETGPITDIEFSLISVKELLDISLLQKYTYPGLRPSLPG